MVTLPDGLRSLYRVTVNINTIPKHLTSMRPILSLFLLLYCSLLYTQDLHIYYDVFADSISYQLDGKRVERPQLKKGQQAILHVVNYNDYLYDLKLTTEQKDYSIPSSGSASPFSGGGGQLFAQLQNFAGGVPGGSFSLEGTNIGADVEGWAETSQVSAQAKAFIQRYVSTLDQMKAHEAEIEELSGYLEKDLDAQRLSSMAYREVQRLKHNPVLSPVKIRRLSMEYLKPVLRLDRDGELEVQDLIERSNTNAQFQSTLNQYEAEVAGLKGELTQLDAIHQLLVALEDIPAEDKVAIDATYQSAERRVEGYQANAADMRNALSDVEQLDLLELTELGYLYEEVRDHKFTKQFAIKPETDITNLKLSLQPTDSARLKGVRERSLMPIELNTYGGIKINASLGLSFTSFFDRPQAYGVRDSLIVGDNQDAFLPVISSFIHFYPQSKRQASIGGTFGIGIGIGGEDAGLQNYFFGPSLILGKGQRVVFSTGLMGGRVERLAQGYEVGDAYELGGVLPTKNIYEFGYFLGISFNLLGN